MLTYLLALTLTFSLAPSLPPSLLRIQSLTPMHLLSVGDILGNALGGGEEIDEDELMGELAGLEAELDADGEMDLLGESSSASSVNASASSSSKAPAVPLDIGDIPQRLPQQPAAPAAQPARPAIAGLGL